MPREKAQAATTARLKVPMRRLGADCFVVVMKRGNARGSPFGSGQLVLGPTDTRRNPMFNGRRQPSCDGTSRMTRECQVRICERLGVKFPGPTRHWPAWQAQANGEGLLSSSEIRSGRNNVYSQALAPAGQANSQMAQTGDKRLKVPDFIGFPRVATFQKKRITAY